MHERFCLCLSLSRIYISIICLSNNLNWRYVWQKAYNVIQANQKSQYFVYRWLHAHAMFYVTHFPAFVWAKFWKTWKLSKTWTYLSHKTWTSDICLKTCTHETVNCGWTYQSLADIAPCGEGLEHAGVVDELHFRHVNHLHNTVQVSDINVWFSLFAVL